MMLGGSKSKLAKHRENLEKVMSRLFFSEGVCCNRRARPDPVGGSKPKPRGRPAEDINQIRLSNTFHSQIFAEVISKFGQAHKHLHLTKYIYNEDIQAFSK